MSNGVEVVSNSLCVNVLYEGHIYWTKAILCGPHLPQDTTSRKLVCESISWFVPPSPAGRIIINLAHAQSLNIEGYCDGQMSFVASSFAAGADFDAVRKLALNL